MSRKPSSTQRIRFRPINAHPRFEERLLLAGFRPSLETSGYQSTWALGFCPVRSGRPLRARVLQSDGSVRMTGIERLLTAGLPYSTLHRSSGLSGETLELDFSLLQRRALPSSVWRVSGLPAPTPGLDLDQHAVFYLPHPLGGLYFPALALLRALFPWPPLMVAAFYPARLESLLRSVSCDPQSMDESADGESAWHLQLSAPEREWCQGLVEWLVSHSDAQRMVDSLQANAMRGRLDLELVSIRAQSLGTAYLKLPGGGRLLTNLHFQGLYLPAAGGGTGSHGQTDGPVRFERANSHP